MVTKFRSPSIYSLRDKGVHTDKYGSPAPQSSNIFSRFEGKAGANLEHNTPDAFRFPSDTLIKKTHGNCNVFLLPVCVPANYLPVIVGNSIW